MALYTTFSHCVIRVFYYITKTLSVREQFLGVYFGLHHYRNAHIMLFALAGGGRWGSLGKQDVRPHRSTARDASRLAQTPPCVPHPQGKEFLLSQIQ